MDRLENVYCGVDSDFYGQIGVRFEKDLSTWSSLNRYTAREVLQRNISLSSLNVPELSASDLPLCRNDAGLAYYLPIMVQNFIHEKNTPMNYACMEAAIEEHETALTTILLDALEAADEDNDYDNS